MGPIDIFQHGDATYNLIIYITSDEEIKEGDYYYLPRTNSVHKCIEDPTELNLERRLGVAKIILTTDQDLIKDGVQDIDTEFLKWFVKNPSCAYVTIYDGLFENRTWKKYIVIPKEESKQENCCTPAGQIKRYVDCKGCDRKPKQETLEEAAKNYGKDIGNKDGTAQFDFIEGAKWQSERMYSEEEVIDLLQEMNDWPTIFDGRIDIKEWFEQFKKK